MIAAGGPRPGHTQGHWPWRALEALRRKAGRALGFCSFRHRLAHRSEWCWRCSSLPVVMPLPAPQVSFWHKEGLGAPDFSHVGL